MATLGQGEKDRTLKDSLLCALMASAQGNATQCLKCFHTFLLGRCLDTILWCRLSFFRLIPVEHIRQTLKTELI